MHESVSDGLWLLAGFLVAAGWSTYLVRRFAWPKVQHFKGVAVVAGLTGFIVMFVLSLLPAAYLAGVSFALLDRLGWPMQVGFHVAALSAAAITAPLTLLLVWGVSAAEKWLVRRRAAGE